MQNSRIYAMKRIAKDLKEIQLNPVEGVGICQLNPNDPFNLLVNIKIMQGRYKDLIVHILLILPDQYPCKPPRMMIFPGQQYDHSFHHHIYDAYHDGKDGYYKFCIDLLDAAYMDSNAIGSGWSPGYTFSTLLMQIQNFLSDPDQERNEQLSDNQIKRIHAKMDSYTYTHNVDGNKIIHSTKQPYPPLSKCKEEIDSQPSISYSPLIQVKERISCFMAKDNFIDNPTGIYGYPIFVSKDRFNRLQQKPIPEILSYEGFKSQLDQYGIKRIDLNQQFKTGMGEAYNAFIPIFLNKEHFNISKKVLFECLASISSEKHFEQQVIQVLPNLINKMLVALLNDSMHQSISAIEAYVHFTQLFHYLIEDNASICHEVTKKVKDMIQSDRDRNKQELGDIGEFLVILSASKYALTPQLLNLLYREYFARQILWIPKNGNLHNAYLNSAIISKKMESIFQSSIISNKLLIFNIAAAQKFANNEEYLKTLAAERYSVISEIEAEEFIKQTKQTISSITTHVQLMDYLGLAKQYPTIESCYNLFKIAIFVSNEQNYTKFNLNLYNEKFINPQALQIDGDFRQPIMRVNDLILKSDFYKPTKDQSSQKMNVEVQKVIEQQEDDKEKEPYKQKILNNHETQKIINNNKQNQTYKHK